MALVTLSSGKLFQGDNNKSILDSAIAANVQLPFGCKNGRCGICKSKISSGSTFELITEYGLSEEDKNNGWILSCCRSIESDIFLEVEDLSEINIPLPKILPCRISKINKISENIIRVYLRIPPKSNFDFLPGQYVNIIGPNSAVRSYSIANSRIDVDGLELHIRAVPGGIMSEYWFNYAVENHLLRLDGPRGTFLLRDLKCLDLVFLATGTGIAPVKAMLESLVNLPCDSRPRSISVYWGGRFPRDFYFDICEININFIFIPVLSRPNTDWVGEVGYIQDIFLLSSPSLCTTVVYACGSELMITSAKKKLFAAGLPHSRFFADPFLLNN